MSSTIRRCTSRIAAAAILLGVGAAAGCSGRDDTCKDIAKKICARLEECGARDRVFVDEQQCLESFDALFVVTSYDDARCRDDWTAAGDLGCPAFLDYFTI